MMVEELIAFEFRSGSLPLTREIIKNFKTESVENGFIYFLLNDNELLYIGQTRNLQKRLSQHLIQKFQNVQGYNLRFNFFVTPRDSLTNIERLLTIIHKPLWEVEKQKEITRLILNGKTREEAIASCAYLQFATPNGGQ
jgi:hypothetical protein